MKTHSIIIALTLSLLASSVNADTLNWTNSGSAAWNNADSWDLNRAPVDGDTTNISMGTVGYPGGDLIFTGTINLSGTGKYSQTTTHWTKLRSGGMTLSDTAIFDNAANGFFLGTTSNATYNLTLNGTSEFKSSTNNSNTNGLKIATNADGNGTGITATVELNDGSKFSAAKIFFLGDGAGNTANFTVNDTATFTVTGTLTLGNNGGVGNVTLNGGTTTLGTVALYGNSRMNLSGANVTVNSTFNAYGTSELNMSAGTINFKNTLSGGRAEGSNAKINISGTADVTISNDVWLGYNTSTGKVAMSISGGTTTLLSNHNLTINGGTSSGSSLSISGGTTIIPGNLSNNSNGVLSISGTDSSLSCASLLLNNTSVTTISGGTTTVTGKLAMKNTASFELSGGSLTVGGDFDTAGSTGLNLTFTGSDYTAQFNKFAGGVATNQWTFNLDSKGIAPINVTTGAYLAGTAHFNLPTDGFDIMNQSEFTLITAGTELTNNLTIDASSPFKFTTSTPNRLTITWDESKIANKWNATPDSPYIIPEELKVVGSVGVTSSNPLEDLLFSYDGALGTGTEDNLIGFLNDFLAETPFSFAAYDDKTLELMGVPISDTITMLNWNLAPFNTLYGADVYFSQLEATQSEQVPEPSTWALLILGALGLSYFRRKKSNA